MRTKYHILFMLVTLLAVLSFVIPALADGHGGNEPSEPPPGEPPVEEPPVEEPPVEEPPVEEPPVEEPPVEEPPVEQPETFSAPEPMFEVQSQGQAGTTLTAEKTAAGYWKREFKWTIVKSVTPDKWDMFRGDSGTSTYTITVTKDSGTDTVWVEGQVCVTNGGDVATENLTIYDHVEYKAGPGQFGDLPGASQTITPAQLAPGQFACYPYSIPFTPVAGAVYRNVATITITNHSGHLGEPFGPEPKADFSLPASPTLINDSINVDDTNGGSWWFSAGGSVSYPKTFTCDGNQGKHDNTATIRETGQSSSASVTVNCYALEVTKKASTSFKRTWTWTIDKEALDDVTRKPITSLILATGQQYPFTYKVTLNASSTDSDWAVSGSIWVHNPAPIAATLNGVSDVVSPDIAASVNCGVSFPYSLAAGETRTCSYSASLPDASSRTNTATATLQNTPSGTTDFSGSAGVDFSSATIAEVDKCIALYDTTYVLGDPSKSDPIFGGLLGTFCADNVTLPHTVSYGGKAGPFDVCGQYEVVNTATIVREENGVRTALASDTWTIVVNVPCGGCTLTPGYWKTHSELGPAPYDATWAMLPSGASTPFFPSGQTYYQVLWTPPSGGNAYYILAHAYIAAELNVLNGADPTAAQAAFDQATELFNTYTPPQVAALKGNSPVRAQFISLAQTLDNYNNGYIGPGHCNE